MKPDGGIEGGYLALFERSLCAQLGKRPGEQMKAAIVHLTVDSQCVYGGGSFQPK